MSATRPDLAAAEARLRAAFGDAAEQKITAATEARIRMWQRGIASAWEPNAVEDLLGSDQALRTNLRIQAVHALDAAVGGAGV